MSTSREAQQEHPERQRRPAEDATESTQPDTDQLTFGARGERFGPPPLDHPSAHRQQHAALLRLQRSHGNRHVSRMLAQRQTADAPPVTAPESVGAPGFILDDAATEAGPGQMTRRDFLANLRSAVDRTASEALPFPQSLMAGPEIERQFTPYSALDAAALERAIRRDAPETAAATSAQEYIPLICAQVRQTIQQGNSGATGSGSGMAPPASSSGTFPPVVSGLVSRLTGLFLKSRDGRGRRADDPRSILSRLSTGRPLDSDVRTQMESAFGQDFSAVRVHTDHHAADQSAKLDARAFTINRDVAFGAGEYQPGTPIGDALIAHELAHVVQQGDHHGQSAGPRAKGDQPASDALEEDADRSAIGAVTAIWGGAKGALADIARNTMPSLRSGLRLQRCPRGGAKGPSPPSVFPTGITSTRVTGPTPSLGPTYYGSIFQHTLTTSGGTITPDITIAELVRVTRDDFATGFAGVPLGTLTWGAGGTANIAGNRISDNIGTGPINVKSFLPSPPKPGLPAVMITPQELHYRIGTGAWTKFADVPMVVTLRAAPAGGYEVETKVNGVSSVQPYTGPV